jgi:hypothetical protein
MHRVQRAFDVPQRGGKMDAERKKQRHALLFLSRLSRA